MKENTVVASSCKAFPHMKGNSVDSPQVRTTKSSPDSGWNILHFPTSVTCFHVVFTSSVTLHGSRISQISTLRSSGYILPTSDGQLFISLKKSVDSTTDLHMKRREAAASGSCSEKAQKKPRMKGYEKL